MVGGYPTIAVAGSSESSPPSTSWKDCLRYLANASQQAISTKDNARIPIPAACTA